MILTLYTFRRETWQYKKFQLHWLFVAKFKNCIVGRLFITNSLLHDNQISCKSEHIKISSQSCSDNWNDTSVIPLGNSDVKRTNHCNNNLIDESIENFICNDIDIIDKPKERLSDNIIVSNKFNCDAHIAENADGSNWSSNDDSNENVTLSNCSRPTKINETFRIGATSNTSTNNNGYLDSKLNDVNNSISQCKYLIDQAQKFPQNFQNNVNVALNPEPTVFNLDVANYLKIQDNSQNHPRKKGETLIISDSILSGFREFKMSK